MIEKFFVTLGILFAVPVFIMAVIITWYALFSMIGSLIG